MSQGINKVMLLGNVGNAPEIRLMPGGDKLSSFSLATSEAWKDKQTGQTQTRTEWHRITCYSALTNVIERYVKKGSKIFVEGKIRTRKWTQDGVPRYSTEVVIDDLQLLDAKQDNQPPAPAPAQQQGGQSQQQAPVPQQQAPVPPGHHANGLQKSPSINNPM